MASTTLTRIADDVFQNEYFVSLFRKAAKRYFDEFWLEENALDLTEKELVHLLRFADILSCSSDSKARNQAYQVLSLIHSFHRENHIYRTYTAAILAQLGNFPGINYVTKDFEIEIELPLGREIEKAQKEDVQKVPGDSGFIFTDPQFQLFRQIKNSRAFSFSGPTSMGKSFIIKSFIREIISKPVRENIVIMVPTRALINQFTTEIHAELGPALEERNYRLLSNSGVSEIVSEENSRFIFILTPERVLSFLGQPENPALSYLFVDEAHKLGATPDDYRSITTYAAVEQTLRRFPEIGVYFASPNVSNPEAFLQLFGRDEKNIFRTIEAPVAQNLFFLDLVEYEVRHYTNFVVEEHHPNAISNFDTALDAIFELGKEAANIVYCNSISNTVSKARAFIEYRKDNASSPSPQVSKAIKLIREFIHRDYFLIECLRYGIAYHFGSLPQIVRVQIEKLYKAGDVKFLFCTSTLLEGVNLPAKNIFILNNKKGLSNMSRLDFWNLAGRAGRLNHEMAGNIICLRENEKDWKKREILEKRSSIEVQPSVVEKTSSKHIEKLERILNSEDPKAKTAKERRLIEYLANILCIDSLEEESSASSLIKKLRRDGNSSIVERAKEIASQIVVPSAVLKKSQSIKIEYQDSVYRYFLENKDRPEDLRFPSKVTYQACLDILLSMHRWYNWTVEEKSTDYNLHNTNTLRYYAGLMNNWMNGSSLSRIIQESFKFTRTILIPYPDRKAEDFERRNPVHVNILINNIIDEIDRVLRYTFERYINNYYLLLCDVLGEEHAGPNWAVFLEYGSTNPIIIALQNIGFARYSAEYLYANHRSDLNIEEGKLVGINRQRLLKRLSPASPFFDEIIAIL